METFEVKYLIFHGWNPRYSNITGTYEGHTVIYHVPETQERREVFVPQGASLIETVTRDAQK